MNKQVEEIVATPDEGFVFLKDRPVGRYVKGEGILFSTDPNENKHGKICFFDKKQDFGDLKDQDRIRATLKLKIRDNVAVLNIKNAVRYNGFGFEPVYIPQR